MHIYPPPCDQDCNLWVNLKAANNSSIQMLGVIQVDIEIWGQTVQNKGVVIVQEVMDLQMPLILGMNLLREIDQQMAKDLGPLYWKQLPHKSGSMLRSILRQCRAQAGAAELQGLMGKIQIPCVQPIKTEAVHEVVIPLPKGTHYNLHGVTVMI